MEKTCYNCGSPISKETCEDFPEVCEHWSPKKPFTNADHIRAMTDEELAKWCAQEAECPPTKPLCQGYNCDARQCWLDWLKREEKDG